MKTLYISCPLKIDYGILKECALALTSELGLTVQYWDRHGVYTSSDLYNADYIAFILPDIAFEYEIEKLSAGIKAEYKTAQSQNKKRYVAYRTKGEKRWKLYDIEAGNRFSIKAIAGSSEDIHAEIKKACGKKQIIDTPTEYPLWNSLKERLEYKTESSLLSDFRISLKTPVEQPDYIDVNGVFWRYGKLSGDSRVFSERMLSSQLTKVRRLLLL